MRGRRCLDIKSPRLSDDGAGRSRLLRVSPLTCLAYCGIHGLFGYSQDSEEDGEQHTQVEEEEQYTQVETDTVVETKHWEVLGLQPGASSREVTTAYRTLSRQHHPDKAGDTEEANRMMSELTAANAAIQSSLDTDLELGDFLD